MKYANELWLLLLGQAQELRPGIVDNKKRYRPVLHLKPFQVLLWRICISITMWKCQAIHSIAKPSLTHLCVVGSEQAILLSFYSWEQMCLGNSNRSYVLDMTKYENESSTLQDIPWELINQHIRHVELPLITNERKHLVDKSWLFNRKLFPVLPNIPLKEKQIPKMFVTLSLGYVRDYSVLSTFDTSGISSGLGKHGIMTLGWLC